VGADIVSLARPPEVPETGPGAGLPDPPDRLDADLVLTALYQQHSVGLIRLAFVMLNDRPAAEDVVQEAFCGLYRRWSHLSDPAKSLPYVRSAVLNGCRSVLRQRSRRDSRVTSEPPAASAEAGALIGEEHRAVLAGLRLLAPRQREALVLRFFLDLDEAEIASSMGISRGTVKSTISRGLAALGQLLGDSR
jgi:RNA polymerase sigma-70 factor (sigma-E family)